MLLAVAGFHEVLLHKGDGSGLVARLVGLSERVQSVAFSPDGKWLAAAGGSPGRFGEVQLWDVGTRKLKLSIPVTFDTLYGAVETEDIEFGHYKGKRKWENLRQIPTQQMRDALMNMIVYQGDTEFASVEQQRNLLENAPTDWDRRAITRVMIEDMRHGWQMCALLIDHFGYSGKVEA